MDENAAANDPAEQSADQAADQGANESQGVEAAVSSMMEGLGQGERLVGIGAALLLVHFVVFEVLIEEYFFPTTLLLIAGAVVLAVWVKQNRSSASWPIPFSDLLWASGLVAGFYGVVEFLTDIRRGLLDDAGDLIGALIFYGACVLMVLGARAIKGGSTG